MHTTQQRPGAKSPLEFVVWLLAAWLALALLAPPSAHAHKPSDSYLTLEAAGREFAGRWDIALRDLDSALGLDEDGDGRITWGELRRRHDDIAAYALSRLHVSAAGAPCPLIPIEHLVDEHTDGAYEVLRFRADCPAEVRQLAVEYRLFQDIDPQHRGLLNLTVAGTTQTAIFSPETPVRSFALEPASRFAQFLQYVREGIGHIAAGYDHILFLLSLLLPAVLVIGPSGWSPVASFRAALIDVVRVVTAFTVAHSLTLSAATLGLVALPSRLVESAIAASVILAALNNIRPFFTGSRWLVAFCFGLIHGFGFAAVLSDLGLPRASLALALLGFNVGVEVGQLAIVALFLPIAFSLRRLWLYRGLVMVPGSALIAVLALAWLIERAFDLKIVPG